MASSKQESKEIKPNAKSRNNTSLESREKALIALTMDAVEERIRTGKASASEYVHFLKLGTTNAELEREKLKNENLLLEEKTKNLRDSAEVIKITEEAMKLFSVYSGEASLNGEDDEYEEEDYERGNRRRHRKR